MRIDECGPSSENHFRTTERRDGSVFVFDEPKIRLAEGGDAETLYLYDYVHSVQVALL